MDEIFTVFNGYFFLTLGGILVGALHFTVRYCSQSNCKNLKCCGLSIMERTLTDENVLPITRNDALSM